MKPEIVASYVVRTVPECVQIALRNENNILLPEDRENLSQVAKIGGLTAEAFLARKVTDRQFGITRGLQFIMNPQPEAELISSPTNLSNFVGTHMGVVLWLE
ncbi:MAG: hypothetical protein JO295_15465 [Verrucomicrobia bacterium]|nr:hypothetical protein [Verrucomicrobiota bacterium]